MLARSVFDGEAAKLRVQSKINSDEDFRRAFDALWSWCLEREFAGADPFDALNSRLFQSLPFVRESRLARMMWTQFFKRSPVNLRSLARVPPGKNSKGFALFALAALARFRATQSAEWKQEARALLDELENLKLENFSGACWGYNFDWQSRAFFAPRGTPTIVPTAFATRAFLEAHEAFGDEKFLRLARSVCDFVLQDLARPFESDEELCFSYTPRDCSCVYNASLLAGETLAAVGARTNESELLFDALRTARYVINQQRADGAWAYGAASNQTWVDNFHTAFVLMSLARIKRFCASLLSKEIEAELSGAIRRGEAFWRANFFLPDGSPKYFDTQTFPLDTHSTASAIITLLELHAPTFDTENAARDANAEGDEARRDANEFAAHLARWAIANMRDQRGFFFYQRKRFYAVRTPYMRWTQGWAAWSLARLLENF